MDTAEQKELLEKVEDLKRKQNLSQNKVGELVGVSGAILSALKNDQYKGDADRQFSILKSYFSTKEAAAGLASATYSTEYKPTSTSTSIYDTLRACQLMGGLVVIGGKAGIGKTMAATKFVADHPGDAFLITLNPCLTTLRSVLRILCNRLNVSAKTLDEMWQGVANKLRDGMILIIDEAQACPFRIIEALRSLSDYFNEHNQTLGIAFLGHVDIVTNFSGSKNAEYDQISNRTKLKPIYTTEFIKRDDITLLFPDLPGPAEIEFLYKVAQTSQAIRGAVNLYMNARNNEDTSYAGLVAMAKRMQLRV